MDKVIKILVADQHALVATGLNELFAGSGIDVVGHAASGNEVLSWLEHNSADIILIDISLPEMDGIDTTRTVHTKYPKQKMIGHSRLNQIEYINSMLIEGASGYILKGADLEEFEQAIEAVQKGKKYLSPEAAEVVEKGYSHTDKNMDGEYISLSPREREIIKGVALEKTNQEIADDLFLSIETIRTYRKSLMAKLDVKSAAGLAKYAADRRWV